MKPRRKVSAWYIYGTTYGVGRCVLSNGLTAFRFFLFLMQYCQTKIIKHTQS